MMGDLELSPVLVLSQATWAWNPGLDWMSIFICIYIYIYYL